MHPFATGIDPEVNAPPMDSLRGVAMLWMTAFHFCFDLQHFGHLQARVL